VRCAKFTHKMATDNCDVTSRYAFEEAEKK